MFEIVTILDDNGKPITMSAPTWNGLKQLGDRFSKEDDWGRFWARKPPDIRFIRHLYTL